MMNIPQHQPQAQVNTAPAFIFDLIGEVALLDPGFDGDDEDSLDLGVSPWVED